MLSSIIPALCLLTLTWAVPINETDAYNNAPVALQIKVVKNGARLAMLDNPISGNDIKDHSKNINSKRQSLHIVHRNDYDEHHYDDDDKDDDDNDYGDDDDNDYDDDDDKKSVLKKRSFNDFSIADGKAGDAETEANDVFKDIDKNHLADVSRSDYEIIKKTNEVCNDAEDKAFNPAIKSADGEKAKALMRGKIKNKVLKVTATKLALEIEKAQGKDVKDKLHDAIKQLKENIDADKDADGKDSKGVDFDECN